MSMKNFAIVIAASMLAPIAFGQCSSWNSSPLWIWDPVYWQISGSESVNDVEVATAGWRDAGTGGPTIRDEQYYDDFDIGNDAMQDGLAYTQTWTPTNTPNYPNACINQFDSCGYCRNANVTIQATIRLSTANIAETQMNYPNWSLDQWTIQVLSHEMGHAFGLNDLNLSPYDCNHTTIMSSDGLGAYDCGFDVAQSYCDGDAVESEYSGASFEAGTCSCGFGAC